MRPNRIAIIALAALCGLAWYALAPHSTALEPAPAVASAATAHSAAASFPARWGRSTSPELAARQAAQWQAAAGPVQQWAQQGQLQRWWQLAQQDCARAAETDCRGYWLALLAAQPATPAQQVLLQALQTLPKLNEAEPKLVQSLNTPLAERLAKLSQLRQQVMGPEVAKAWFGQEEALVAYKAAVNDFARHEAKTLRQPARLQALEALRVQHYGDYYAELKAAETPAQRFELEYRLALLDQPSPEQAAQLREQLLNRYFEPLAARERDAQFRQQAQQQQQRANYQQGLQALAQQRQAQGWSEERYAQALAQWRAQVFGPGA
ncbi:lipase secretion chaperone [Chitinibacter sp. ZOR0017]|uniref:lipase secretion chaperone n=1 Tax=Chitinibacter sp. ZOR0017 TaxID=1339254 RepID=UPI0006925027|nr:lipase secretion chaperone [Chitinibacter sp. ZOR0017]